MRNDRFDHFVTAAVSDRTTTFYREVLGRELVGAPGSR